MAAVTDERADDAIYITGAPLPDPEADPVHDYLLESGRARNDPVDIIIDLRDGIEDFPETKALFTLSEALSADIEPQAVQAEMLHLIGSWRTPRSESNDADRWVNPAYPHKARYTDVRVECECGATMTTEKGQPQHDTPYDANNDHRDDCTKQMRYRARANLCERRAEAIREAQLAGHSSRSMGDRLGVTDSVGSVAPELGIDIQSLKEEFRQSRYNTMALLLTRHPTAKVARAYGVSQSTVRHYVASKTPYNISDFNSYREANDA